MSVPSRRVRVSCVEKQRARDACALASTGTRHAMYRSGSRAVNSPLYVDLDGLADDGAVLFQTRADDGFQPKTLVPIGDSSVSGLRTVSLPISSGPVTLDAGAVVTARLYYRSVEDGTLGDIVPLEGNVVTVDGEGTSSETQIGGWSNDARLTLYIDLE